MNSNYTEHILDADIVSNFYKSSDFVSAFFNWQMQNWASVEERFKAVSQAKIRNLFIDNEQYILQYNPARVQSTTANVDPAFLANRPCFLCANNLPPQQSGFEIETGYLFLINPFPIFDIHFTIISTSHIPQRITDRIASFLSIAKKISGYTIFYNGPESGASAPDHFHFQALPNAILPIEGRSYSWHSDKGAMVNVGTYLDTASSIVVLRSAYPDLLEAKIKELLMLLPKYGKLEEPMMNIIIIFRNGEWTVFVVPRSKHRPWQYNATDNYHCVISPASVDFGGFIVLPRAEDFEHLNAVNLSEMLMQVAIPNQTVLEIAKSIKKG